MGLEEAFENQAPEDAKVINEYIDSIKEDKQQLEAKILKFHHGLNNLSTGNGNSILELVIELHKNTFGITNDKIDAETHIHK